MDTQVWIRQRRMRWFWGVLGLAGAALLVWLCTLISSDPVLAGSTAQPYYIVSIMAVLGVLLYWKSGPDDLLEYRWLIVFGIIMFALMITLSNYPSWYANRTGPARDAFYFLPFVLWMFAGLTTGYFAFQALARILDWLTWKASGRFIVRPVWMFLLAFLVMAAILLVVFFSSLYPGLWLSDSISQIKQTYTNVYSNHHPFAHTMVIKALFSLGYALSGSPNGAMAAYSLFSILIMSLIIAYAVMTLYEITHTYWVPVGALAIFALSYYNWFYAVSVLKDSFFSMAFLGFLCAMLRIIYPAGRRWANLVWLGVFTFCTCVFRSNGLIAVLALAVLMWICLYRRFTDMKIVVSVVAIGCVFLTGPVYSTAGITQPFFGEQLSIPIQQISRIIWNKRPITARQVEELEELMPLENFTGNYTYWLSDPVKFLLTTEETDPYLKENLGEYAGLWWDLARQYPMDFVTAWVGQTMGYWNGSYPYWRVLQTKKPNEFGMFNTIPDVGMHEAVYGWASFVQNDLSALTGIGFHTWIVFAIWIYMLCERKKGWPAALFVLLTTGTLVLASPVYSEFRYAYYMFLSMPLLMALPLLGLPHEAQKHPAFWSRQKKLARHIMRRMIFTDEPRHLSPENPKEGTAASK